jgi:hypothetical protein
VSNGTFIVVRRQYFNGYAALSTEHAEQVYSAFERVSERLPWDEAAALAKLMNAAEEE